MDGARLIGPPVMDGARLIGPPVSLSGVLPLTITLLAPVRGFDAGAWVRANEEALANLLTQHGAVRLRGFLPASAESFSQLVKGFSRWRDLPYEDSLSYAVRLPVCERVCTTNEAKNGGMMFHHEQAGPFSLRCKADVACCEARVARSLFVRGDARTGAAFSTDNTRAELPRTQPPSARPLPVHAPSFSAAPRFPSKLLFYCERPATTGGATGVAPSWRVLEQLEAAFPGFVADCETKGVRYSARLPPEQDASKGVGRSWRSFFWVTSRRDCEARLAHYGYEWTWDSAGEDATLAMTTPVLAAVRAVPGPHGPRTRVFFNQMVAQAFANAAEFAAARGGGSGSGGGRGEDEPAALHVAGPFLTFGDGSPVPLAPLRLARQVAEAEAVELEWREGDVGLLDNLLVMHARRGYEGPRRVLASLVE